jgi:hypothetical protein
MTAGVRDVALVLAGLLGLAPTVAAAADDRAVMTCAINAVYACSTSDSCVRGIADTVALPRVLKVDLGNKRVSGDKAGRTARITSTSRGGGKLMVLGEEVETRGVTWSVVVKDGSGEFTGAVLSEPGGYLLFGRCTG